MGTRVLWWGVGVDAVAEDAGGPGGAQASRGEGRMTICRDCWMDSRGGCGREDVRAVWAADVPGGGRGAKTCRRRRPRRHEGDGSTPGRTEERKVGAPGKRGRTEAEVGLVTTGHPSFTVDSRFLKFFVLTLWSYKSCVVMMQFCTGGEQKLPAKTRGF